MSNEIYKLLGKMSLEFRLSLDNLCKLLGQEPNDLLKTEIYEKIVATAGNDVNLKERYRYLFGYETIKEPKKHSKVAYAIAYNYIARYKKANELQDKDKITALNDELNKTEIEFNKVKSKFHNSRLSLEDVAIIAKYRIKFLISRDKLCQTYELSDDTIRRKEKEIESSILKSKLELLSEYYMSFNYGRKK